MAFNGSGTFSRIYNWVNDRNAALKIRADRMDAEMDGFATGLSTCITKDGQTTISANIPFNNKRITGLGDASADTDALNRQTGDGRYLYMARADVASASTTDLSTSKAGHQRVTGTTTITSFGTGANLIRMLTFAGALTLTHDGTSLILPAGINILTAAGDTAVFASDGSGNWRCLAYQKADAQIVTQTEEDVASASTCDIGAAKSDRVRITGTTTITSFGTGANRTRWVRFADALTLTHGATTLILPGGANITTAAGDVALFKSDGSGNWRCYNYQRAADGVDQFDTATQTEMEALTAGYAVTPPNQHYHPGHPKTIAHAGVTGNILFDYNVSSITDTGTGDATCVSDLTYSSTGNMVAVVDREATTDNNIAGVYSLTTTSVRATNLNANTLNRNDPASWFWMIGGDI
ncbi:MAG: hypothetical protein ACRCV5_14290 [Afipia sp.]